MSELAREIEAFLVQDPFEIGRRTREGGRIHEYFFTRYVDPPDSIGLIVGDAFHNLRSALDHVAFELARIGAAEVGATMTDDEERRVQYPVCESKRDFAKQLRADRLKYVNPGFRDLIERYQPYNFQPDHPDRAIFSVVSRLDNYDKHRTIPVLSSVIEWDAYALPPRVEQPKRTFIPTDAWRVGEPMVRFQFGEPHPELDLDFSPTFRLAIDGAWPPTSSASDVLGWCADAIEQFIIEQVERGVGYQEPPAQ